MGFISNIEEKVSDNPIYISKLTKFKALRETTRSKLQIIPYYFRHFSRHDETHSEAIIHYIEMLLGKKAINELSLSDQLMIELAAYLHDIGMSLEYDEIKAYFSNREFESRIKEVIPKGYKDLDAIVEDLLSNPAVMEKESDRNVLKIYSAVTIAIENVFRNGHAQRSAEYIVNDEQIQSLLGIRCTKLLANICQKHESNIEKIMDLPYEENGIFGDYMHPRFIAGMLCLGDLLDLDTDRFNETVLKASCEMPLLSQIH